MIDYSKSKILPESLPNKAKKKRRKELSYLLKLILKKFN